MRSVRIAGFALVAVVASIGAAYAQDTPSAGVFVGVNQSHYSTNPENDGSSKSGVVVGAFAIMRKDKGFKIQPEIQYSQRKVGIEFGGSEVEYHVDYFNLALMTRLKLYKSLYTSTGVQFSIPVKAELDLGPSTADIKDNIKSDLSIPIGVGVQFSKRIGIEGRYDAGLKSVEEAPLGNTIKRNRALTFLAVLGF